MMARRRSTVHLVAGARPNFMKVAPVYHGLKGEDWARTVLIHTGQHYDANMSDTFLRDLGLPAPDVALGVGSGSHAEQTARVMIAYEKICMAEPPDWVVVVGDVNSTLACALVAAKLHIRLAHLEAGLRSFDRTMPEEINRVVTDALADVLWTPSPDADANLRAEGIPAERIERVGNVMIDAYEMLAPRIAADDTRRRMGLGEDGYAVVTLHRPTNVDDAQRLGPIVAALVAVARRLPLVFPLHQRTRQKLQSLDLMDPLMASSAIHMSEPLSYIPFMGLVRGARMIITDSGGLQEETTYLNIPCVTLRDTTERPITISQGTNRLARAEQLDGMVAEILAGDWPQARRPDLWDGHTARRIASSLKMRID